MEWILNIVNGLIEACETEDIYEIVDCLEITIIRKEFTGDKKARFYRDIFGNEYIYLSPNLSELEEKFILAHEIGHAILHTHISSEYYYSSLISKDKVEYQADYFAATLLTLNVSIDDMKDLTIEQISAQLGVPERLLERKLTEVILSSNIFFTH